MGLLHSSSSGGRLPCRLRGQLLPATHENWQDTLECIDASPGSFTASRLARRLLGASHFNVILVVWNIDHEVISHRWTHWLKSKDKSCAHHQSHTRSKVLLIIKLSSCNLWCILEQCMLHHSQFQGITVVHTEFMRHHNLVVIFIRPKSDHCLGPLLFGLYPLNRLFTFGLSPIGLKRRLDYPNWTTKPLGLSLFGLKKTFGLSKFGLYPK